MKNLFFLNSKELNENCGVAAVSLKSKKEEDKKAVFYLYRMLINLQHRGQLSAGITTFNQTRMKLLDTYRNIGSVNEVFKTSNPLKSMALFKRFMGNKGIGHVRYATFGQNERSFAQPFERHHGRKWKWFSFCFNGNIANYQEMRQNLLAKQDYHLSLEADTEILMHYIARELMGKEKPKIESVFSELSEKIDGAYNIAYINGFGDLAVIRDPLGFRPMVYAVDDGNLFAASESNALLNIGLTKSKSLDPGCALVVEDGTIEEVRYAKSPRKAYCMFEWVYFASVGSVINDISVYQVRKELGIKLARRETQKLTKDHIVVPVPDTAKAAADSYAYELGLPVMEGLIRNRYVGRTFIEASKRASKVQSKYTVLKEVLKDKKVLLIDDSIVRGTTVKGIIRYIKEVGGAKEVHLRVTCPPIRAPCCYGIDMSTIKELLVPKYEGCDMKDQDITPETEAKIAEELGADSLIYQTQKGLIESIGMDKCDLCMACINSDYPTKAGNKVHKEECERFINGTSNSKRSYE